MDDEKLCIQDICILRGQQGTFQLPLPSLHESAPLSLPVHVKRGKKRGPTLVLTAAIHGDEINGTEILRRLLKKRGFKNLRGTVVIIPVVNFYGFLNQSRYMTDRRDLNRSFPGSPSGSLASRLAHLLVNEILVHANYAIDFHSASNHRINLPQLRVSGDHSVENDLAEAFQAPVILKSKEREGTLRSAAHEINLPYLLFEGGEALRFDEPSINVGLRGIINVMRKLKMIPPLKTTPKNTPTFHAKSSYWIRSPSGGIFRPLKGLGKNVKEGETIGLVCDPAGTREDPIRAAVSGIIISYNKLPLTTEGAALFNIACFQDVKELTRVSQQMEDIQTRAYIDLRMDV